MPAFREDFLDVHLEIPSRRPLFRVSEIYPRKVAPQTGVSMHQTARVTVAPLTNKPRRLPGERNPSTGRDENGSRVVDFSVPNHWGHL